MRSWKIIAATLRVSFQRLVKRFVDMSWEVIGGFDVFCWPGRDSCMSFLHLGLGFVVSC
jgi:hypothetical protein